MAIHNLEHLRTFLTVYRVGSLTEAARLLGISQPTASTHVHSLEENLGLRLFDRSPSGVTPTPKAEGLARDVGPHIDALDDLAFMSSLSGANESIDLGGPAEFLSAMLLPSTPELTEAIGARLRIRFGLVDGLLEALRAGDLDIVVSAVRPGSRASPQRPSMTKSLFWSRLRPGKPASRELSRPTWNWQPFPWLLTPRTCRSFAVTGGPCLIDAPTISGPAASSLIFAACVQPSWLVRECQCCPAI
jgi:DNA-binding transcriptional LysR family regulator